MSDPEGAKVYRDAGGAGWVEDPTGAFGWWSVEPGGPNFTDGQKAEFWPHHHYPPEMRHGDLLPIRSENGQEVFRRYRLVDQPAERPDGREP